MTISETKESVRQQINDLIDTGVLKNDAQLANEIGMSKSAISSMLSPKSKKRVSQRFILELDKRYFTPKDVHDYSTQLKDIIATQNVLLDTCAQLLSQVSGKAFVIARAELTQAIKMNT